MDFRRGCRGYTEFPTGDAALSLQWLTIPQVVTIAKKLEKDNYYDGDSSNIAKDQRILDDCDKHARQTNDFYVGGRLEYYMKDWIDKTKDFKQLKTKIKAATIGKQIQKYNDYLDKAKANAWREKANKMAQEWNNRNVPKKSTATREVEHSYLSQGVRYYYYTTEYKSYTSGRATGSGWETINPPSGWSKYSDDEYDVIQLDNSVWDKVTTAHDKKIFRDLKSRGIYHLYPQTRPSDSKYSG